MDADLDLSTLDPGIRAVVALVRLLGFSTFDSGDGATKTGGECECEVDPYPHVRATVDPLQAVAEALRLAAALEARGVALARGVHDGPSLHLLWSTHEPGLAVLELVGLTDDGLALALGGADGDRR